MHGPENASNAVNVPLRDEDWITQPEHLLPIDEVLTKFESVDPAAAEIVKLRFFMGMTVEETAEITELSPRTVKRQWAYARARLQAAL